MSLSDSTSNFPLPPLRCVTCASHAYIERVRCPHCETAVEGKFSAGWMQRLSPEQIAFVRVFVSCRGKIKDVEQALGVSYPTVVARLDEVVAVVEPGATPNKMKNDRRQVLEALSQGHISADEAAKRIRAKDEGSR